MTVRTAPHRTHMCEMQSCGEVGVVGMPWRGGRGGYARVGPNRFWPGSGLVLRCLGPGFTVLALGPGLRPIIIIILYEK